MRTLSAILLISLCGCNDARELSSDELNSYVQDVGNNVRKIIRKGNYILEFCYRPKDFIISQQVGVGGDHNERSGWEKKLEQLDYFVLRLSDDGEEVEKFFASDPDAYNRVLAYLSGSIRKDITLNIGGSRIQAESFIYMPSFGSSASTTILVVFRSNLASRSGRFTLVFDDSILGTGRSEFNFHTSDIENVPRLQI